MVREEVYAPLQLSAGALTTLRTDNSPTGNPFGGYGLFLTTDDIAKIAKLLNNDGGKIGGTQVLHPSLLADSQQENPSDRGMNTTGAYVYKYNNGFWALQMTPEEYPALTQPIWIVWMSGFGGIEVVMMPNGSTYYYFSDNDEWPPLAPVVMESNKLIPHTP